MVDHVPFTEIYVDEAIVDRTADVLRSTRFVKGPELEAFEDEFAEFVGVDHAVGVSNGTAALELALRATDVGPGDEVFVPAHTFVATASAVYDVGATPVFVDVDPETYTMAVDDLERTVRASTNPTAVIPVHIYGHPADVDAIDDVADEFGLTVVEDACQSHAATYRGQCTGSLGDVGCFSFYPSKNMTVGGDGGMLTTDDEGVADRVRRLRDHGRDEDGRHVEVGGNYRLGEVKAAFGRVHLDHVVEWGRRRRENARRYDERLADVPQVRTPPAAENVSHVYHLYEIQADHRDELREYLDAAGVETAIHYPNAVHQQPAVRERLDEVPDLSYAERLVDRIVSLPMHPWLSDEEIAYVCERIERFYGGDVA